jgi:hypothetical protein
MRLIRLLPILETTLTYDLFREAIAIYLKLPLWLGLSLMATMTWNSELGQPEVRLHFVTMMAGDFTVTGPEWKLM